MLRTKNVFLRVLSASLIACTWAHSTLAQDASLDQYKQNALSYRFLQIGLDRHKAMARAGLTRNDWCALAEIYDGYSVSLKREIEQRRYLTGTGGVDIKQADLNRFKIFQDGIGVEARNAERRCR